MGHSGCRAALKVEFKSNAIRPAAAAAEAAKTRKTDSTSERNEWTGQTVRVKRTRVSGDATHGTTRRHTQRAMQTQLHRLQRVRTDPRARA